MKSKVRQPRLLQQDFRPFIGRAWTGWLFRLQRIGEDPLGQGRLFPLPEEFHCTGRDDEDFRIWRGDGIIDIDCGCGHHRTEHRRLAGLRLDDMAEFYVGGSGCGERSSLPAEELEPLDEQDLPASLQRDLDAYREGLVEHVSYLDCLWCELYGSINSAQWSGEISEAQARCLREKYLF